MDVPLEKLRQIDRSLSDLVRLWFEWDKNGKTITEVESLLLEEKYDDLRARMVGRLSFGTAGMRAAMSCGFSRFNDLTMIQTAQGMLRYLQKVFTAETLATKGVVVGYDARHNSEKFAKLLANIFARNAVKVNLFSKIVPTPFVSYAIIKLKSVAGAMITASHNPKEDNGFKVYWSNGAQILSPHDSGICASVLENLVPSPGSWDVDCATLQGSKFVYDPFQEIFDAYFAEASNYNLFRDQNAVSSLKFTYTAVHGVGYFFTPELLRFFGFKPENLIFVKEQIMPDPDFPTAPFPNPEEGASVLGPAFRTADENSSTLILANDPDADRFQLAEKQPDGTWRIFTGNEMGGLLAWWLWHTWRLQHPDEPASNVYMINSAVSSRVVDSMARSEGFRYEETLTGFKWMANRAHDLAESGKTVLLCWEESIGYMPRLSLDKDGVLTAALFAEYAAYLKAESGGSFASHLLFLGQKYGYHVNENSYFICNDPIVTKKIFDRLRNFDGSGSLNYPKTCGQFPIKFIRDLTIGFDNNQPNNKPVLPVSQSSQMITFTLENGSVFTLRASGTEPKIKYYIEVIIPKNGFVSEATPQMANMKQSIIEDFLQPELNKLIAKI